MSAINDAHLQFLGPGYDRRIVLPNNPYKFRAYLSASQTATANTITVVNLDTTTLYMVGGNTYGGGFDTSGNFDTSAHVFTVPISGYYYYSVTMNIDCRPTGANSNLSYSLSGRLGAFIGGIWTSYVGAEIQRDSVSFNSNTYGVANVQVDSLVISDHQFFFGGQQLRAEFFGTNSNVGGGLNGNNFVLYGGASTDTCSWSMHLISA